MKNPLLIHAVVALLIALLSVGGYMFFFSTVNGLRTEARSLQAEIETKNGDEAQSGTSRAVLNELAAQEKAIAARFVPETDIVSFLEELEAIGRNQGASVRVVSVSDPADDGRITIALSIEGSFDAVVTTAGIIEHGAYGTATKSLTIDTIGEGIWTAAFTLLATTPTQP